MRKQPFMQGRLDGLCGLYSVINSVTVLARDFSEDDASALFKKLIEAKAEYFPQALYDGLGFLQVWDVCNTAREIVADRVKITMTRPYFRTKADSLDDYFGFLRDQLSDNRSVAIIGLSKPWFHWTVVTKVDPASAKFFDSYGIKRMNFSALSLTAEDGKTGIDHHQTILLKR